MAKIFEYKQVIIYKDVFKHNKCDICGKETTDNLIDVKGFHEEWGNDSIESNEKYEICSAECYKKAVFKFLDEFEEYKDSAVVDGKPYNIMKNLFNG